MSCEVKISFFSLFFFKWLCFVVFAGDQACSSIENKCKNYSFQIPWGRGVWPVFLWIISLDTGRTVPAWDSFFLFFTLFVPNGALEVPGGASSSSSPRGWGSTQSAQGTLHPCACSTRGQVWCKGFVICWVPTGWPWGFVKENTLACELSCPLSSKHQWQRASCNLELIN